MSIKISCLILLLAMLPAAGVDAQIAPGSLRTGAVADSGFSGPLSVKEGGKNMEIKITSTAFQEGGMIPRKYTCDGDDVSPPIAWSGIPDGTKSIALISDDPDAPVGTWVHWVIFNIPPDETGLEEGLPADATLPNGAVQGVTDFRRLGYGGPCPPGGTHRYFFKLYALDSRLNLKSGCSKKDLLAAMEGHTLAEGQLMGKYSRR